MAVCHLRDRYKTLGDTRHCPTCGTGPCVEGYRVIEKKAHRPELLDVFERLEKCIQELKRLHSQD